MSQSELLRKWKRGELKFKPPVRELAEEAGLAQYPTSKFPRPGTAEEDIPYYWWFRFLQLNEDYAETSRARGVGAHAAIYKDLGDVAEVSFADWWDRHYHLFSEPVGNWRFRIAKDESALAPFGRRDVVNIVVPLTWSRERLREHFEKMVLSKVPEAAPGKSRVSSRAQYQLAGRIVASEMRDAYRVYQERHADAAGTPFLKTRRGETTEKVRYDTPWWTIAIRAGLEFPLDPKKKNSALLREGDKGPDTEEARARATEAARRHYDRAALLKIAAASRRFPGKALERKIIPSRAAGGDGP